MQLEILSRPLHSEMVKVFGAEYVHADEPRGRVECNQDPQPHPRPQTLISLVLAYCIYVSDDTRQG